MKKIIALVLAVVMMMAMATVASASTDATFTKTYKDNGEIATSPEETFTFNIVADRVVDVNNKGLTKEMMPAIDPVTTSYARAAATEDGEVNEITVALSEIKWPHEGIYIYKVTEVDNHTAGVTYDGSTQYLKVTVAYDAAFNKYYTAFVTLSLDDADGNGVTDDKSNGFENIYNAGELTVTKTVAGNMGDKEKEFNVTVTFTAPAGDTVKEAIVYNGGSIAAGWTGSTSVEITVKDGSEITFTNIPYGVIYSVVEDDYSADGYETETDYSDNTKKIDSTSDTVDITNTKDTTVDTGIVMDSVPFIVMAVIAVIGLAAFTAKKRVQE